MQVTTTTSQQTWQSPDGKRTIWEVGLKASDGTDYRLKTYSADIARLGFSGEVRSYLNPRGDRFVKQVESENSGYKGGYGGGNNTARAKQDADKQSDIKAEWAIGKAISSAQIFPLDEKALKQIEELACKLYAMVDRVKGSTERGLKERG